MFDSECREYCRITQLKKGVEEVWPVQLRPPEPQATAAEV